MYLETVLSDNKFESGPKLETTYESVEIHTVGDVSYSQSKLLVQVHQVNYDSKQQGRR